MNSVMEKYMIFLLLFICSSQVMAQVDTIMLSSENYRERVLNYSLDLKQADEGVAQAVSGVNAIKSGMMPQISAEANFSQLMKDLTIEIADFNLSLKPYNYGATLTAVQNIYSGGVLRKKTTVAEKNIDIAKSSRLLAIDNIRYSADYAYWSMTAINAYKDISERYLEIVKETSQLVQERYESGLISKNDLLLIQTRVSEAELNYSLMQSRYKAAVIGVNIMMGMQPETPFRLTENVVVINPELPSFVDALRVLEIDPEYAMANYKLLQSQEEVRVTRSDYLPQIAVGVGAQYETELLNFDGSADFDGVVFAKVAIPIFGGNSKRHRLTVDYSRVRSYEYELNKVRDKIIQEVAVSSSDLSESFSQLAISSNNYKSAKESLDLSTYSFNQGLLSIIDLMQAQLSWLGAINSFVEANYNYHLALVKYYKTIGVEF